MGTAQQIPALAYPQVETEGERFVSSAPATQSCHGRNLVGLTAVGLLGMGTAFLAGGGEQAEAAPAMQTGTGYLEAGETLKIVIPEAAGGKVILGNVTADQSAENGYVTAYDCGKKPLRSDLNPVSGAVKTKRLAVKAGDSGEVCFYTLKGTHLIVDVDSVTDSMIPVPSRRIDTRETGDYLDAGQVLRVKVPEAEGGETVIGNLTTVNSNKPGYVTAYPCDEVRPLASDINPMPGEVVTNLSIGRASNDGEICFYTKEGTDLIFDITAVDKAATSVPPQRTDTRVTGQRLAPGDVLKVNLFDALGGETVFGNLTYADADRPGYITAWSCAGALPIKSELNPAPLPTVSSNMLIVEAGGNGDICFYSLEGTELIFDPKGILHGVEPLSEHFRLDTRVPKQPAAGEGVELVSVSGSKWVDAGDIVLSCVSALASEGKWNRYTFVEIHNQQPSQPPSKVYGGSVDMTIYDNDFAPGNNQYEQVFHSVLADPDGVISGYSTTHMVGQLTREQASRVPANDVIIDLWERVPPGSDRRLVGTSIMTFTIDECPSI